MKRVILLLASLLCYGFAAAQFTTASITEANQMFVGFMRQDGVFVIYDAKGLVTIKEGKFAEKVETTELKLSKFLAITDFCYTLDEARGKLGLPPVVEILPEIKLSTKTNSELGVFKDWYGANYKALLNEVQEGTSIFEFYGQNVNYPAYNSTQKPSTDKLTIFGFPTHSIINTKGLDYTSKIEMQLLDSEGLTIWYLNDTKSGWHPSTKDHLRGNNHPDDANRWLKYGKYKLWIKNNSTDKRAIQNILFGTARGTQLFEYDLKPGHDATFDLNLIPLPDEYDFYKLNCNVK